MEHDKEVDPLISWQGRGYPPAMERLQTRLRRSGQWDRIEAGRGWWPLLVRLHERLARIVEWYGANCIREVDGLLRFDASSSPDSVEFTDLVWEAMLEATRTCSACGAAGVRRRDSGGRYLTRCDDHARALDDEAWAFYAEADAPAVAAPKMGIVPSAATSTAVSALFEESVARTHLAAEDVASTIGVAVEEVYRLYLTGELVGARGDRSQVVYPRWQLHNGVRIPGLTKVAWRVKAWAPLDARAAMLRATEDLNGMSPVAWLVAGYPVGPVTALLLSYDYEGMPEPATESKSGATFENDRGGEEEVEGFVERVWREVRGRLEALLGPGELAAALGAYAADNQDQLRIAEVRRLRADYGTPRDPSAEDLFPLLLAKEVGNDGPLP